MWIVPALPLAGAAINLFAGKRLGRWAGVLASGLMVVAFALGLAILADLLELSGDERFIVRHLWDWISVGSFRVAADLRVDPLSVTMLLVITGIGAVIHVYSIGYMDGDPRYGRFFSYMNLFCFFMLTLVLAQNFLLLYVGWEGVGLCSYLLIGFWFDRPAAASAAKKAFVVTRIGDTFMLVGIALVFLRLGSLDFSAVLRPSVESVQPSGVFTVIALLLFAGAVGKSAQIPLHTWLPDAMEGPTPVSALIHAATMVTAGVYLVARTHVFFEISGVALTVVLVIGLLTAVYAATCALGQDDLKRVLAYSTISQLGYMFFALGLRAYAAALFLLVTHAFYKALLFLSAGSVMHGLEGETDLKMMGALRRALPVTAAMFGVGALAIAGVPPLSGFFAKDQILEVANRSGYLLAWLVALAGAFLSALYISRLTFLAFFGRDRTERAAHESPAVMTVPLAILAVGAAFGGVLGLSATTGRLHGFLAPVLGELAEGTSGLPTVVLSFISVLVALAGIGVGWLVYGSGRIDWVALRVRFAGVQRFLAHGWYVDDVYSTLLVGPGKAGAAFLASEVDQRIIDGAVNGVGQVFQWAASRGRRLQTGLVRNYGLAFLVGVVVIFVYVGVRLS
ncbi:MAG TPA: NADH-quinone oxidoreductase subunit L [Actinomycetota bacterium]|nr:NADH-quinone oxidoreductase subunit L [Actinomycetota bacterium]